MFRDMVFAHCQAQSRNQPLLVDGAAEDLSLLEWLGVTFEVPPSTLGSCVSDSSGYQSGFDGALAAFTSVPPQPLANYRRQGLLGETLYACLIRSSYGPDEEDFFPTKLEMSLTFDENSLLKGNARWDQDYLLSCQRFFMEELTPAEILCKVRAEMTVEERERAAEAFEQWFEEFQGVALVLSELVENLLPMVGVFSRLVVRDDPEVLSGFCEQFGDWSPVQIQECLKAMAPSRQRFLEDRLFPGFPEHTGILLAVLGPRYMSWRTGGMLVP